MDNQMNLDRKRAFTKRLILHMEEYVTTYILTPKINSQFFMTTDLLGNEDTEFITYALPPSDIPADYSRARDKDNEMAIILAASTHARELGRRLLDMFYIVLDYDTISKRIDGLQEDISFKHLLHGTRYLSLLPEPELEFYNSCFIAGIISITPTQLAAQMSEIY